MNSLTQYSWQEIVFDQIVKDSAFGPRFPGTAYADDGNIATLRTTDISADGRISYDTMPLAQLDEACFANHFLKPGDLVITRSGRIGTTAIFEEHEKLVLPGAFLIRFRLSEEANSRFFCYWFNSILGQQRLLSVAQGAAQQNINITNVKTLKVPLPPLQGQESIVSILSAYDDLIKNNRRRIQLLEQTARLLYKEWFVHLRFPGHEHTRIIDGVPEGWSMRPIKDVVEGVYDGPHATPPAADDGPIFLGIKNITYSGGLNLTSKRCISENDFPKWTRRVTPQAGDIVFSYEATLNLYALIPDGFRGCLGRRLALIRPIAQDRTGLFIYYSFFTHRWRTVIEQNRLCGATVDRVPIAKFPDFPLLIPPRRLTAAFDDHVSSLRKQMETLERENDLLAKARDLLLPKLMNGEVAV